MFKLHYIDEKNGIMVFDLRKMCIFLMFEYFLWKTLSDCVFCGPNYMNIYVHYRSLEIAHISHIITDFLIKNECFNCPYLIMWLFILKPFITTYPYWFIHVFIMHSIVVLTPLYLANCLTVSWKYFDNVRISLYYICVGIPVVHWTRICILLIIVFLQKCLILN